VLFRSIQSTSRLDPSSTPPFVVVFQEREEGECRNEANDWTRIWLVWHSAAL